MGCKMKRFLVLSVILIVAVSLVSCAAELKGLSQAASYKDPQTLGGYWDVTMQTGQTFNHVKCTYWGTADDTAVFETDDGTVICQSGAVVCVRCR